MLYNLDNSIIDIVVNNKNLINFFVDPTLLTSEELDLATKSIDARCDTLLYHFANSVASFVSDKKEANISCIHVNHYDIVNSIVKINILLNKPIFIPIPMNSIALTLKLKEFTKLCSKTVGKFNIVDGTVLELYTDNSKTHQKYKSYCCNCNTEVNNQFPVCLNPSCISFNRWIWQGINHIMDNNVVVSQLPNLYEYKPDITSDILESMVLDNTGNLGYLSDIKRSLISKSTSAYVYDMFGKDIHKAILPQLVGLANNVSSINNIKAAIYKVIYDKLIGTKLFSNNILVADFVANIIANLSKSNNIVTKRERLPLFGKFICLVDIRGDTAVSLKRAIISAGGIPITVSATDSKLTHCDIIVSSPSFAETIQRACKAPVVSSSKMLNIVRNNVAI